MHNDLSFISESAAKSKQSNIIIIYISILLFQDIDHSNYNCYACCETFNTYEGRLFLLTIMVNIPYLCKYGIDNIISDYIAILAINL